MLPNQFLPHAGHYTRLIYLKGARPLCTVQLAEAAGMPVRLFPPFFCPYVLTIFRWASRACNHGLFADRPPGRGLCAPDAYRKLGSTVAVTHRRRAKVYLSGR